MWTASYSRCRGCKTGRNVAAGLPESFCVASVTAGVKNGGDESRTAAGRTQSLAGESR